VRSICDLQLPGIGPAVAPEEASQGEFEGSMVAFAMIGILVLIAFLCLSNGIAALTEGKGPRSRRFLL